MHNHLQKFTLRLYREDMEILKAAFPPRQVNRAIRDLVHQLAKKIAPQTVLDDERDQD